MSKLVAVNSTSSTTVSVGSLDRYIINGAAGTTYNYNLPTPACDGMSFSFTRVDRTTAVVNLNGTIKYNGTSVSTYNIRNFATVTVISLGSIWNVIYDALDVPLGLNNIFSGIFIGNNGNPYININSGTIFLFFAMPGGISAAIINTIVFVQGVGGSQGTIRLPGGTLIVTPVSTTYTYTLTADDKNRLSPFNYISMANETSNPNYSSIVFYV